MGFKAWETPPEFFKALDNEFHFTLDAASSHHNHLAPVYCTENGVFGPEGSINDADGLTYSWAGYRVFCNPPYDQTILQWVKKGQEADLAVFLLPPSVDTRWYSFLEEQFYDRTDTTLNVYCNKRWRGHKNSDGSFELLTLMEGRLKFWKDGKVGPAPRAGNVIAIFRK